MRSMLLAAALAVASTPVLAAPCHDTAGKFIKCPVVAPAVVKDKFGKCHVASGPNKGKFAKCP